MPRIKDALLDCSVYLYPSVKDAMDGEKTGGSGFLVGVPSSSHKGTYIYAVTNKHVILKQMGNSPVIRIDTKNGNTDTIDYDASNWYFPDDGDDLAVAPINVTEEYKYNWIPQSVFITPEIITKEGIGAGDEVFMVGRFIGYDGKQKNEPTIRFGNLSLSSTVKIKNKFGINQESFLIEVRSLSGYSGSPVNVKILPMSERPGKKELSLDSHMWLLGVDWGHQPIYASVLEKNGIDKIEEGWKVQLNSGIACVIPAWKLSELLDIDEFMKMRIANDKEIADKQVAPDANQ